MVVHTLGYEQGATRRVFNNETVASGRIMVDGETVLWDSTAVTGPTATKAPYVKRQTADDSALCAGVVVGTIRPQEYGEIVEYGAANCIVGPAGGAAAAAINDDLTNDFISATVPGGLKTQTGTVIYGYVATTPVQQAGSGLWYATCFVDFRPCGAGHVGPIYGRT